MKKVMTEQRAMGFHLAFAEHSRPQAIFMKWLAPAKEQQNNDGDDTRKMSEQS